MVGSSNKRIFQGCLGVQQRVLPAYRGLFFDTLTDFCANGLSLFAGDPQPEEQIPLSSDLEKAKLHHAVNRHLFKISSPYYQCWQPGIIDWLEETDPDALIVEANPRYPSNRKAVRWMQAHGRPVLGWGLGAPAIQGYLSAFRRRGRDSFLLSLDGLIAYSQRGAQEYRQLGFPPDRVFTAPNAVTRRPASPPPERALGYQDRPVLIFVGRLQSRKRIDLLLRACAAIPTQLQPRLWIVGEGPARTEFEALAKKTYPEAEFLGPHFGSDLEALFSSADLFVLPGTGGLAVQQAMSYGLPVVVAEGDGTQEDLVRPGNGWQIQSGDLSGLTEAIADAFSDPARLRAMGEEFLSNCCRRRECGANGGSFR